MKYLLIVTIIFTFSISCKKEQQAEMSTLNAGCDCAKETSADFVMEELTTPNPNFVKYTSTDTIFADKNVRFRALENNTDYTWIIGAEILTGQEVTRYFGPELEGQVIPIKLIVKKDANNICFPGDDGVDTITKFLVVGPEFDSYIFYNTPNPRFEGVFRMKEVNSPDSIDITVEILGQVDMSQNIIKISNWNGSAGTIICTLSGSNYHQIFFDGLFGYEINTMHKSLNGGYELDFTPDITNLSPYLYRGRKLS